MTTPYKQALTIFSQGGFTLRREEHEAYKKTIRRALLIADAVESGVLVKNTHEYGYGEGENWGEGYNDCLDDLRRLGEEGSLKKIGAGE